MIGVEGNPNTVNLTYSNDPNQEEGGTPGDEPSKDSPVGVTPDHETRTYVTGIELIKVDPEGQRLTGAEFKLEGEKLNKVGVKTESFEADPEGTYWKLTDGSYTTDDPTSEGMDTSKYEDTTTKYTRTVNEKFVETSESVTATGTVGEDGVLRFEGLSAGNYTITELTAPDGYNKLSGPIEVTITWTAPVAPSTDCTWTTKSGSIVDGIVQIEIENNAGTELPSTGGMGTTVFYLLGGVLVLFAVVLLVVKRRMKAE